MMEKKECVSECFLCTNSQCDDLAALVDGITSLPLARQPEHLQKILRLMLERMERDGLNQQAGESGRAYVARLIKEARSDE